MINKKQKNIPKGWFFKNIGEVLDYEQPTSYIVESTDYNNNYKIPVLTAGKTFILGYTNEQNGIYKDIPVIIFDDFTTAIKYVNFSFKVKSSAMKILKNKPKKANLKFVYGWMQIHLFAVGEHKRNYLSEYQYQDILLPTIDEQNKIVQILETWDEYLKKITKKIEIKKSIKKGLMQKLLRGELRLKGFSEKWKNVKLGDAIDFKNGKAHEKDIVKNGKYIVVNSKFISSNTRVFKCSDKNLSPLSVGEITMVMSDIPNGKAIAKCFLVDEDNKYTLNQRICSLKPKNGDSKFLYYILSRNKYFLQFDDGVNQTNLRKDDILDCYIEIPGVEEQRAIAKVLIKSDQEIEALENKKKIIEDQKRYLLNNLIIGKIRVPEFEKVK